MSSSESEYYESDQETFSEVEDEVEVDGIGDHREDLDVLAANIDRLAYSDEPLADEEWIKNYEQQEKETAELEEQLVKRLNGSNPTSEWCKCNNCDITLAKNISETYCCKELEGCVASLDSDEVKSEMPENEVLGCVIDHPGFKHVCLEKWSLRLAADKYRRKNKESYKATGSEERFLRSVSYREFTRLVYGRLGKNKRYPLPSCASNKIRRTFVCQEEEEYKGFELVSIV